MPMNIIALHCTNHLIFIIFVKDCMTSYNKSIHC